MLEHKTGEEYYSSEVSGNWDIEFWKMNYLFHEVLGIRYQVLGFGGMGSGFRRYWGLSGIEFQGYGFWVSEVLGYIRY